MRSVLIYRSELLAYSETFIAAQASAMRSYVPVFAGMRRMAHSLSLPGRSMTLADSGSVADRARRLAFLRFGHAPELVRDVRAESPVLLHAHFAPDAAEALPLARALALPMIVTLHGYDVMANDVAHRKMRRGRLYLARQEDLWRRARLFLCVSEAVRSKAIERGFPAERLRVLPIGVDLTAYRPPVVLTEKPVILFVGRLVEKKGCVHLVRAMRRVREQVPEAQLVILGDGPERAGLEEEARGLAPGTIFLGVQSATQVKVWMTASRVLAVPSVTARSGDAEGLPTVLGEALASGLPVVGFRSSGIPELVRDGLEGLLSEEGDEEALARGLVRVCQDDELAAAMSRAGRARVERGFDLSVQTAGLEEIYGEVLRAAHPAWRGTGEKSVRDCPERYTGGLPRPMLAGARSGIAGVGDRGESRVGSDAVGLGVHPAAADVAPLAMWGDGVSRGMERAEFGGESR